MALSQAKEPSLQVLQGEECAGHGSHLVQPELEDCSLGLSLDLELGWLGGQPISRMRKAILHAQISQLLVPLPTPFPLSPGHLGSRETRQHARLDASSYPYSPSPQESYLLIPS